MKLHNICLIHGLTLPQEDMLIVTSAEEDNVHPGNDAAAEVTRQQIVQRF